MEPTEFKVGVKFKYMGDGRDKQLNIVQTVTDIYQRKVFSDIRQNDWFLNNSRYASDCVIIPEPGKLYTAAEVEQLREKAFDWGFSAGFNTEDIAGIAEYKKWRYGLFQKANPL